MKDYKHSPLPSVEDDMESLPGSQAHNSRESLAFKLLITIVGLTTYTALVVALTLGRVDLQCVHGPSILPSIVRSVIRYQPSIYIDHEKLDDAWFGEPSEGLDHMWHELTRWADIRVPEEEVVRLGRQHDTVQFPDGGYYGQLAIYHHLHCLVSLPSFLSLTFKSTHEEMEVLTISLKMRVHRHIYLDHYFPNLTDEERKLEMRHAVHCLTLIKDALVCNPDTSIMTMRWWDYTSVPSANWSTPKACVNWDAIDGWAQDHHVNIREPGMVVHPTFVSGNPESKSRQDFILPASSTPVLSRARGKEPRCSSKLAPPRRFLAPQPHPHHRASLFRYLFPRLSQRYRERLVGFHLDTLPYYKHRFQSRVYRFLLERQRRRSEQSRIVDRARRLLLGPPKPKSTSTPTPRAPKQRDVIRVKRRSVMSYISGGGADVGGKRKKLAAMAGRVYSAGASAMAEIRESYNQTRTGQADTEEIQKITIPGAFPDVKIVVQGDEQMVLFPSYAKRHIKDQSRQYEDPAGPPATSTVDIDEEEYWRQEWARHEDEKAIVDVDVRGWIYNPHRGPMTRRNRILIGLARQLSGVPTPQAQQQNLDPSPASIHQLHEEEREQRRIAQEAQEIERRGQAERAAALNGGYSEAPKDADSEDEFRSSRSSNSRSRSPTPSVRSAPRSPIMGASKSSTAGGSQLSEAELAVANANLMARIAPFMTTPLVQRPITVFFYNDSQSQSKTVTTNDSGHFILRAPLDFVPTHIRVLANEDLSATEPVHIIEPEGISLISDIDDTIKHSSITTGAKEIFRNTFIRDLGDLTVDGVREWYTSLHDLGVRIHYCSNSPWQLYPVIATYFKMAGLPPGSIHLKQYSGMLQGIFEPVAERKKGTLEKIMHDFPQRRFLLVGDSGEADLEVYTEIAVANPGRIVAIFIRDVTTPERSGYFDSGFGHANRPELARPPTSTNSSRNNSVDDRVSRPHLPPRTSTKPAREEGLVMGDLIDLSEEPLESPPQESRHLQEMRENLPSSKKAPPPRPAKPTSLKSSSSVASLNGAGSHAETPEQKKPPLPPARRNTPSNNNPAKPGAAHPLSQMQNSSQQGLNASHQNLARTASYDRRGSGSSKSGAPPPPPPPRRTNTSSSLQQASSQGTKSSHRGTPDSDVDAMDSLPPSSYQSSTYNTGSAPDAPLNKKLDLWHRRLQRAQDTLDQHGVALYTWRRGGDVIKEADGLVRQTMKDMGVKVGEGEKRDLKNKR